MPVCSHYGTNRNGRHKQRRNKPPASPPLLTSTPFVLAHGLGRSHMKDDTYTFHPPIFTHCQNHVVYFHFLFPFNSLRFLLFFSLFLVLCLSSLSLPLTHKHTRMQLHLNTYIHTQACTHTHIKCSHIYYIYLRSNFLQ